MATILEFLFSFFFFIVCAVVVLIIVIRIFVKKMQNRFQRQFNQQYGYSKEPVQPEGKVTVEKTKSSSKTRSDNVGDYIDFEEVDE